MSRTACGREREARARRLREARLLGARSRLQQQLEDGRVPLLRRVNQRRVARAVAAVRVDVLFERRGRVELQLVLDGHDAVAALDRRDDAADAPRGGVPPRT